MIFIFIFFIFKKSTFLFESSQIYDQQNTLRLVCKFTISLKKCNMTIKYSVYILRCSNSCQGLRDTNYRTMILQSLSYRRFVPVIVCTGSHSFMLNTNLPAHGCPPLIRQRNKGKCVWLGSICWQTSLLDLIESVKFTKCL